jgi:hypothetical protein
MDIMTSSAALSRDLFDNRKVVRWATQDGAFGRNFWGLFCLELWQRQFHDQAARFRDLVREPVAG